MDEIRRISSMKSAGFHMQMRQFAYEIRRISWNLLDFTMKSAGFHEIRQISPWNLLDFMKFAGFHHEIRRISWIVDFAVFFCKPIQIYMKSAGFHEIRHEIRRISCISQMSQGPMVLFLYVSISWRFCWPQLNTNVISVSWGSKLLDIGTDNFGYMFISVFCVYLNDQNKILRLNKNVWMIQVYNYAYIWKAVWNKILISIFKNNFHYVTSKTNMRNCKTKWACKQHLYTSRLYTTIWSLTSSLVTTAGTNTRNTALRIIHTDLYIFSLKFISNKTRSILQIVTLDITQLNVHKHIKKEKTAEAVILQTGSTITEKEQLPCNTH